MKNTNLLGISGKIGSGKDTVGKIIQILTSFPKMSTERVVEHLDKDLAISKYKIKKFADKLKDIVCILIGCTRQQLEDREFKERSLGEEWWCYDVGSGVHRQILPRFYYPNIEDNVICEKRYLTKLTPRLLLQLIGTECGRNIIHPNVWVNALFSEYKGAILPTHSGKVTEENCYLHTECDVCKNQFYGYKRQFRCKKCTDKLNPTYPNWIITDMRFPNELKAVEDRGGITIRVNRDFSQTIKTDNGDGSITLSAHSELTKIRIHPSETALDNATFDYTIDNNSSIEDLIEKVREILIKEQII